MDAGTILAPPLVFLLELGVLYAAGLYAMGRLVGALGVRGGLSGRLVFYVLVMPGVVLHESAHYLACLLTGTRVLRFAPFLPGRMDDGRLMLGYVRHERRALPVGAAIGLAPMVLNPLGLLLATAALTPLTLREVAAPSFEVVVGGLLTSGFPTEAPLLAAAWAYLALSFALGSVPSREDLAGLPLLLALFGAAVLLWALLRTGSGEPLPLAFHDLSSLAAGLYALPAAVAVVAAVALGVWTRY